MLKRLGGVSSKLAQNKLFLPGFPATSLLFSFFSSPQQLTKTLSLSPHLNQRHSFPLLPGQRQTRELIIFLSLSSRFQHFSFFPQTSTLFLLLLAQTQPAFPVCHPPNTRSEGRQTSTVASLLFFFFFSPSSAPKNKQRPALSLSSLSLPAAPALSPLPLINTKSAADLHLSFSFTAASTAPATPPAASSATTASTGASLRLPASSPGQQQSSIPAAAATPGEEQ